MLVADEGRSGFGGAGRAMNGPHRKVELERAATRCKRKNPSRAPDPRSVAISCVFYWLLLAPLRSPHTSPHNLPTEEGNMARE